MFESLVHGADDINICGVNEERELGQRVYRWPWTAPTGQLTAHQKGFVTRWFGGVEFGATGCFGCTVQRFLWDFTQCWDPLRRGVPQRYTMVGV